MFFKIIFNKADDQRTATIIIFDAKNMRLVQISRFNKLNEIYFILKFSENLIF